MPQLQAAYPQELRYKFFSFPSGVGNRITSRPELEQTCTPTTKMFLWRLPVDHPDHRIF